MRTRFVKAANGCNYVLAASMKKESLWLNPEKVKIEFKPLFSFS